MKVETLPDPMIFGYGPGPDPYPSGTGPGIPESGRPVDQPGCGYGSTGVGNCPLRVVLCLLSEYNMLSRMPEVSLILLLTFNKYLIVVVII